MKNPEQTLLILTPAFAAYEGDNYLPAQEQFILTINKIFPRIHIIILSFHFPAGSTTPYNWYGNTVIPFGSEMKRKMHSLLLWKRVWQKLSKLNHEHNILGIFSFFCSESAFLGHYFAKRKRLHHFIWILGQDAKKENKQVKRIRPKPNELIAISDFLVREFEKNHGIRPSKVVPIGISPAAFSPLLIQRNIDILGVGSLSLIKQYDLFVEVVDGVRQTLPKVKAVICGDGTERLNLQRQISAFNLEENVRLNGKTPHKEVLRVMQGSKILLHTSAYEGFGMVCTEALYAGAHIISFCKPMNAQIEHWHIVENKSQMITKAIELLNNQDKTFSSSLPFHMEDTARQIMHLFDYHEIV